MGPHKWCSPRASRMKHHESSNESDCTADQIHLLLWNGHDPRREWTNAIERRISSLVARHGQQLVRDVFEDLAATYVRTAVGGRIPAEMHPRAYLCERVAYDSLRSAKRVISNRGGELMIDGQDVDDGPVCNLTARTDVEREVVATAMLERIAVIADELPSKERTAVQARLACDLDPEAAYVALGLAAGTRERGNHNQAYSSGIRRISGRMHAECWYE